VSQVGCNSPSSACWTGIFLLGMRLLLSRKRQVDQNSRKQTADEIQDSGGRVAQVKAFRDRKPSRPTVWSNSAHKSLGSHTLSLSLKGVFRPTNQSRCRFSRSASQLFLLTDWSVFQYPLRHPFSFKFINQGSNRSNLPIIKEDKKCVFPLVRPSGWGLKRR
jgi:hypothetical protein